MPTTPMIVPLLVTGILFGHILHTKKERIGRKLIAIGSLLGGLGNTINAAVLYLLQSRTTTGTAIPTGSATQSFARPTVAAQNPVSFLLLSFVVGVLIVMLVIVPAVLAQKRGVPHLWFRRGEEESVE